MDGAQSDRGPPVRIDDDPGGDVTVVHVDDDPEYLRLVAQRLEAVDDRLSVVTATTGREGLDRLEAGADCAVLDYDMPDIDGLALLERIREGHPRLPVILFTGKGSEAVASEAISSGVTDYLKKRPGAGQYELLANRINNAVSQYRAERRAERMERWILELAENTDDVLWMFTRDWDRLLFVNSAYETIWGRDPEVLTDHPQDFLNGIHPEDRDRVRAAMRRLSAGEPVDLEYRVNKAQDFGRWVWVKGTPVFEDGEVVRVTGFARDVTRIKRREGRLDRKNERLENLQGIASHELRNPLEAARGHLELAKHDHGDDHLEGVENQLARMETIVEDMLALAREGELVEDDDLEPVDLGALVGSAWATVGSDDATLRVEDDATVLADEGRLRQVVENLLANAVEHAGPEVTVRVGIHDTGFFVADDGPGIDFGDRVFEPGYTTARDGTGLGLSIVSELAAAHGWDVDVTDSDAGGARFEVSGVEFA